MDRKSLTLIAGLIMVTASGSDAALAGPEVLSNGIAYQTLNTDQMSHIVGTQAPAEALATVDLAGTATGPNAAWVTITGRANTADNGQTHSANASGVLTSYSR